MNAEKNAPTLLGAAFLLQAVASLVSTFLLTPLVVPGNIKASMINIANNSFQMRASILGEIIAVIGIVMLGSLLYMTLKKQNGAIALISLGLYLVTAAIIATSRIAAFSLMQLSQEAVGAGHSVYFQTLGKMFYELQEFGYFLHMLPYTLGATLFYYLFFRSGYLPKFLAIWGLMAAPLAFVGSVFDHLGIAVQMIVFLPNLPFDLATGFWLMVKGFRSPEVISEPKIIDFD